MCVIKAYGDLCLALREVKNDFSNKMKYLYVDLEDKISDVAIHDGSKNRKMTMINESSLGNFSESEYTNSRGKKYPCYSLNVKNIQR